jgi:hypothetical protein
MNLHVADARGDTETREVKLPAGEGVIRIPRGWHVFGEGDAGHVYYPDTATLKQEDQSPLRDPDVLQMMKYSSDKKGPNPFVAVSRVNPSDFPSEREGGLWST